jgi:predicted RecB family nuclease
MKILDDQLTLSATDVAVHLGCHHLTQLDLRAEREDLDRPCWPDPIKDVLREKGEAHEQAYLQHLREQDLSIKAFPNHGTTREQTLAAMREGFDVIYQPKLDQGRWVGRADFLRRASGPSDLGDYHYEVVDTKLAAETKAGTVLQLCVYSELVGSLQGRRPDNMMVVTPGTGYKPEVYRVDHFEAYYKRVRVRLEAAVEFGEETYPEPCEHCHVCDWWKHCDDRRHADDHLSLVANITRSQRVELARMFQIETLTELGSSPLPPGKPVRGSRDGLERAQHQAYVQLKDRSSDEPYYEVLDISEGEGLCRLPEPSMGDVFFDLEGDQFVGDPNAVGAAGLEYLWGWVTLEAPGDARYHHTWADDYSEERDAFEAFIDEVMARRKQCPDMHVYHYAPYEPGAMKRLMGRYATRESEIDELLRAKVFVDLYLVTRQAVRAGVESYSIKDLERFFGYDRQVDLQDVSRPKRALEALLESDRGHDVPEEAREIVRGYNEDDCVSTWRLREWLEARRDEVLSSGVGVPRPELGDGEPGEVLNEWQQELVALRERLIAGIPPLREDRDEVEQARWLFAYMLDWHWREDRAAWWEYFRLKELPEDELVDEKAALTGLHWVEKLPPVGNRETNPRYRYRYPPQNVELREGAKLFDAEGEDLGSVVGIDTTDMTIDIKHVGNQADARPTRVFECTVIGTRTMRESLMRLGAWIEENGVDAGGAGSFARAGRDLLLGHVPRRRGEAAGSLREFDEAAADAARGLAVEIDGGVLPIQGPPGSGKTYAGARMILELVRQGKRVGVTAVSHKVIDNLLQNVLEAAGEEDMSVECMHKVSEKSPEPTPGLAETMSTKAPLKALETGKANVVGGTAWLWVSDAYAQSVDVLFVDEAGQMSLANVLAVSQAASNLVLLGDPQQLEQPQKGSHPEGTDVSALQHVLGDESVMPPDRGLFLEQTWRLHPKICAFTSGQFYDGELASREGMERQVLSGATNYTGAGLWVEAVEHEGNQSSSAEEVEQVAKVVTDLQQSGVRWTDKDGKQQLLQLSDILVVAPYNAQVVALKDGLPGGISVGTVDKFQGQEAPVVIYSMATSSPEEAPRGMEFLYSLNRLNVATSRARCACVMVANPALFEPECRSVRQMRLANGVCAYRLQSTGQTPESAPLMKWSPADVSSPSLGEGEKC